MLFADTPLPSIICATVRTSYQGIAARSPSSGPTSLVQTPATLKAVHANRSGTPASSLRSIQ
ncbi:MAG: hypothetical protein ACJ8CS_19980, partial [Microvirga sp.]